MSNHDSTGKNDELLAGKKSLYSDNILSSSEKKEFLEDLEDGKYLLELGNGKDEGKSRNKRKNAAKEYEQRKEPTKTPYYIQKYSELDFLVEAMIVAGKAYFTVAKPNPEILLSFY